MRPLKLISITQQVAAHLREEIEQGLLAGEMPGAKKVAERLGVNHKTVDAAVAMLEKQGLLESQGTGKPRLVITPKSARTPLRVAILTYEPEESQETNIIIDLRHSLTNAGHSCCLSEKSQRELRWDVKRIERMVRKTKADAWIIQAGSREILEWFGRQPFPSIALYGRFLDVPIAAAGVLKAPAVIAAVDHLVALGHRSMVMLAGESDRLPSPGLAQRLFLGRLARHGIETSSYNLPHWESSPEGLQRTLDSLFQVTPPTAIFITDVLLLFPTYTHLLQRGIGCPGQVSLICHDYQPQYLWCRPAIAHISWDLHKVVRLVMRWADAISRGKEDKSQKFVAAELIVGGTLGPPPKAGMHS